MIVIANSHTARLAICWLTMFLVGTELFVVSPLLPMIVADFQSSPALAGLSWWRTWDSSSKLSEPWTSRRAK